ncbi:MAG: HAD-IIIA family hydrolase [Deltaproteobacteria bacterium]
MNGIVFLDRDGTLIEDVGYLSDPGKLRALPGAFEATARLSREGLVIAVVSNQAGLARGKFGEAEFRAVHRAFVGLFRERGIRFDAVEYCPHHPDGTLARYRSACECRKPGTGMAEKILARLGIPAAWPRYMVGDKMVDIVMGKRLGARTILVETGYGREERRAGERDGIHPDAVVPGIREAADWILGAEEKE